MEMFFSFTLFYLFGLKWKVTDMYPTVLILDSILTPDFPDCIHLFIYILEFSM